MFHCVTLLHSPPGECFFFYKTTEVNKAYKKNLPPPTIIIIESSDNCGTNTLVTYYLNFIARQDICVKCLKGRKTRYCPPPILWKVSAQILVQGH